MTDEDDSLNEETVRKAVDHVQSGAPATGSVVRDRFSADEIFQRLSRLQARESLSKDKHDPVSACRSEQHFMLLPDNVYFGFETPDV